MDTLFKLFDNGSHVRVVSNKRMIFIEATGTWLKKSHFEFCISKDAYAVIYIGKDESYLVFPKKMKVVKRP